MKDLMCEKCKRRVVMPAFSEGRCFICGKTLFCENTPPDVVCADCAKVFNACIHCGEPLERQHYEFV